MERDVFFNLPTSQIASIVQASESKTFAFPINGTRRWFLLEQMETIDEEKSVNYLTKMIDAHISQYSLFFRHGVQTLLAPIFGPDLLDRGHEYTSMAISGIEELSKSESFLKFYEEFQVRVRFYGDYKSFLGNSEYSYLLSTFAELEERTASYNNHRLFFGVCANDSAKTTAQLSIAFFQKNNRIPEKYDLIESYYGESVDPLKVFIGFDKFTMFDVPLLMTGNEDLYFTVSPSLYMNKHQLREILYDHLYARRLKETDYSTLTSEDLILMNAFYTLNKNVTLGIGDRQPNGDYWYPTSLLTIPDQFIENRKK